MVGRMTVVLFVGIVWLAALLEVDTCIGIYAAILGGLRVEGQNADEVTHVHTCCVYAVAQVLTVIVPERNCIHVLDLCLGHRIILRGCDI